MMKRKNIFYAALLVFVLACNLPGGAPPAASTPEPQSTFTPASIPTVIPTEAHTVTPESATATAEPQITHVKFPSESVAGGGVIYDVESSSTAAEKRAPYGDSYNINRLERPFLKDMTYVSDLDISKFTVSQDGEWYYVSIDLIGTDPNNALGIHYGVELDTNHDGFGDHIIWASPPYSANWDTANVKIYSDTNHDTGGLSAERSDAPITTNGYDALTFNGGPGDADPDLAWVRVNAGAADVQFAFKSSWSGGVFMIGVMADAGLKDVGKLDYVDRFTEEQAGSPVKDKKYYPLGELFAVDNTCFEAFGFKPTGYEPRLCPRDEPTPAPRTPKPGSTQPPAVGCVNPSQYTTQAACQAAGCRWAQGGWTMVYYYCTMP